MKYLLFFLLIGCTDKEICDFKAGLGITSRFCNNDGPTSCQKFCIEEKTTRIQESSGVCLCDNEHGRKAQEGYHKILNGDFK